MYSPKRSASKDPIKMEWETKLHLMVRFHFWIPEEYRLALHRYYSQVYSDLKSGYLLGPNLRVK